MSYARLVHVGPENGPHASFRDLWFPASEGVGTTVWETVDTSLPPAQLQDKVDWILRKYRPRVLVTHWEGAESILPWVTYRRRVRLVCHRYCTDPMPLHPAQRMLYSMVKEFVVPDGGLVEFVKAAGIQERRITAFPLVPRGLKAPEIEGTVLGILPASESLILNVRSHVEKKRKGVRVIQGHLEQLLQEATILLDLEGGQEVCREYLDAVLLGKHVLIPDSALMRSLYGDSVTYYQRPHLFAVLKALFSDPPEVPQINCEGSESAVESIGSAYRKAVA